MDLNWGQFSYKLRLWATVLQFIARRVMNPHAAVTAAGHFGLTLTVLKNVAGAMLLHLTTSALAAVQMFLWVELDQPEQPLNLAVRFHPLV
jgi:hypothetical protein